MSYKRKTVEKWKYDAIKVILGFGVVSLIPTAIVKATVVEFASPLPLHDPIVMKEKVYVEVPEQNIDTWIREAAARFANTKYPESYLKYQLHCLANKESGHRHNDHTNCGDSGASCGLYQYKQATWKGFRKLMIKEGLATEVGSLWDNHLQIETTAWALSEGRHQNWGPWMRGDCH